MTRETKKLIDRTAAAMDAARESLGISRADLARRLKVTPAYVSFLLNGKENVTLATLVKVAKVLECSISVDFTPRGR